MEGRRRGRKKQGKSWTARSGGGGRRCRNNAPAVSVPVQLFIGADCPVHSSQSSQSSETSQSSVLSAPLSFSRTVGLL